MNDRLFVLLAGPSHIDVFGLDDDGLFARLARAGSWLHARAVFQTLPAYRRHVTLVATGAAPPDSFLRALAPCLDSLVVVPHPWLEGVPHRRPRLRARRAVRIVAAHIRAPIETHADFAYDNYPF